MEMEYEDDRREPTVTVKGSRKLRRSGSYVAHILIQNFEMFMLTVVASTCVFSSITKSSLPS